MKRIVLFTLAAVLAAAAAFAQAPYPYRALDPGQFDPKVDPDIDMFVNHWKNSTPRIMFGDLIFRDILTGLEGPDVLHPAKKGAVLVEQTAISYATLEPGAVASGRASKGEQQVFYVTGGTAKITAGNKSFDLKEGMGFILTPEFDLTPIDLIQQGSCVREVKAGPFRPNKPHSPGRGSNRLGFRDFSLTL